MVKFVIVSWCLVGLLASVYSAAVPSYIKVCKRRDPNLSECVKNSVLGLRDKLISGIPELGVPSIEPLSIDDDLTLADSQSFSAKTKNVLIYGIPTFDDLNVKVDLDRQTVEINLHFDRMRVEGDYDIKARILVPITAQGPIQIETRDVTAKIFIRFKIVQYKGEDHAFFSSTSCKLTVGDYTSHFVPLPGQDQTFAQAINDVLNNSKQEILAGIIGGLEVGVAKKATAVANGISKSFSYADILPL